MKLNRRRFAALAAAAPALAAPQQPAAPPANPEVRRGTPPEVPPFGSQIEFSRRDVAPKVRAFPMTQVRLLPGRFTTPRNGTAATCPASRPIASFATSASMLDCPLTQNP